jgi:hypothetical protein
MTWSDIVTSALVLINEATPGETLNVDEVFDGGVVFNALLAAWNLVETHVFNIVNYQGTLTGGTGAYQIGVGATAPGFNTIRPVKIESAGVILGGVRTELQIINSLKWAQLHDKAATALVPELLYNDNNYPLATLNLWPKPSGTPTLDLYMWGEFSSVTNWKYTDLVVDASNQNQVTSAGRPFTSADIGNFINIGNQVVGFSAGRYAINSVAAGKATLSGNVGLTGTTGGIAVYDQIVDFPPGYLKAIRYNLAVDLAPEYGRAPDPSVEQIAVASLAALRAMNESNELGTEQAPPAPPQVQQ